MLLAPTCPSPGVWGSMSTSWKCSQVVGGSEEAEETTTEEATTASATTSTCMALFAEKSVCLTPNEAL